MSEPADERAVSVGGLGQPAGPQAVNESAMAQVEGGPGQPAGSQVGSASTMAQVVDVLSGLVDRVNRREFSAPEVFTVGAGRSIEDFFKEFEDYAAQRFGPSEASWLPRLGQYLAEPLSRLYADMRSVGANYGAIKGYLVECYGAQVGAKTSLDYMQEFHQTAYDPEEGIPGLVCRLQALSRRAYHGLPEATLGELVKQQCWKVLPEYLRTPLQFQSLANPGMTIPELIRLGVALQRSDLASANLYSLGSAGSVGGPPPTTSASPSPARDSSEAGAVAGGQKQCSHCKRKGHLRRECYRLNRVCYGCGERGHFRAQCPNSQPRGGVPVSGRPLTQTPPSPATAPGSSCPFCGTPGHMMAACPEFETFMARLLERKGALN